MRYAFEYNATKLIGFHHDEPLGLQSFVVEVESFEEAIEKLKEQLQETPGSQAFGYFTMREGDGLTEFLRIKNANVALNDRLLLEELVFERA